MRFPAGEVDLTLACRPGRTHVLSMLVVAMPLKGVMLSYSDTRLGPRGRRDRWRGAACAATSTWSRTPHGRADRRREGGHVGAQRGRSPSTPALEGLAAGTRRIGCGRGCSPGTTSSASSPASRSRATTSRTADVAFTEAWQPGEALGHPHARRTLYDARPSRCSTPAARCWTPACPVRFGFREFWIDGRDFYLNGTRIFLSRRPARQRPGRRGLGQLRRARGRACSACKSFGINFVYTHNYGCEPGSHLSFAEILRAADDVGMLVSLSQPHFGHYDWKARGRRPRRNGYARHAAFYARVAGRIIPSVVMYSMSHNATGYSEDMNPDLIDGIHDRARASGPSGTSERALRAEAIVERLDPSRIVYHHSSGNLGSMHTSNFYPNFVPIQEMSDWFEHWADGGSQAASSPASTARPSRWDWTMYRGWYKGQRELRQRRRCPGSSASRSGTRSSSATRPSGSARRRRRTCAGRPSSSAPASSGIAGTTPISWARATSTSATRCWPRTSPTTGGPSAPGACRRSRPGSIDHFWKLRAGVDRDRREELPVDWENLQRPGFSPDYLEERYERMDLAYERSDWIATPAARAMFRNNRPLLAYIAGPARRSPRRTTSSGRRDGARSRSS